MIPYFAIGIVITIVAIARKLMERMRHFGLTEKHKRNCITVCEADAYAVLYAVTANIKGGIMEPKFILRFIMFNHVYFIGERFEFNFNYKKQNNSPEKPS